VSLPAAGPSSGEPLLNARIPGQGRWLGAVVRGHHNYYAVPDNDEALEAFPTQVTRHWHRALGAEASSRA
jgi:hypothetical protein